MDGPRKLSKRVTESGVFPHILRVCVQCLTPRCVCVSVLGSPLRTDADLILSAVSHNLLFIRHQAEINHKKKIMERKENKTTEQHSDALLFPQTAYYCY